MKQPLIKFALILSSFLAACATTSPAPQPDTLAPASPSDQKQIAQDSPNNNSDPDPLCPTDRNESGLLPGISHQMLSTQYWAKDDRIVMSQQAVQNHNARFYNPMSDLCTPVPKLQLELNMKERLVSFHNKFQNNEITFVDGTRPPDEDFDRTFVEFHNNYDSSKAQQFILLEDSTILCGPHDQPYIKAQDGEIRFSRNNCSLGRAQSRVEVLYTHPNGMRFVRTADMWGWLSPNAKLSPPIDQSSCPNEAAWFASKPFQYNDVTVPKGAFLSGNDHEAWLGTPSGFVTLAPADVDGLISTNRPLTRKAWFETLFLFLNDPYGWGGYGGWRDCSRLIYDAARAFRINLPRNSKFQAVQTSYYINVEGMSADDKLKTLDDAFNSGIVLLHFPGHMMAYLGRNKDNHPVILHALSEYYEACDKAPADDPQKILVHVDRVVLSDLSLGENTSRTSFLNRITHIAVLTDMTRNDADSNNIQNAPWPVSRDWTPEEETLYAAFFERLFDYPDEPDKTWNNLGDVLRDKNHNILYNALGQNEDDNLKLAPDCADLPYMLRAYFAWKRGLPMAARKCSRGSDSKPPRCYDPKFMTDDHASGNDASRYNHYAVNVATYQVHSGNARTALDNNDSDFYPVELSRHTLRPGQIYADPHGHILMIAHYTPDSDSPGAMLAVDAQPDGTITRKRFWKGNFLFDPNMKNVGAGFKAFRPIVQGRELSNDELNPQSGYIPYSTEQQFIQKEVFYDRVDAAIHPTPLAIPDAITELTNALHESAERRVLNVQNGDDYIRANGDSQMIMPLGYPVFETTGPWEDFATPSRDMRMLIAIDAVRDFPAQIERNAARYGLTTDQELQNTISQAKQIINDTLANDYITYNNSLGQPVRLSLKAIVDRALNLEMAYHPADCNELRWGAPPDSDEYKTCSRTASPNERSKMEKMRPWFHQRVRPPR